MSNLLIKKKRIALVAKKLKKMTKIFRDFLLTMELKFSKTGIPTS